MPPRKKRVKVQRLTIYLKPSSIAWLKLEAERLDYSMSEVIRHLIAQEQLAREQLTEREQSEK